MLNPDCQCLNHDCQCRISIGNRDMSSKPTFPESRRRISSADSNPQPVGHRKKSTSTEKTTIVLQVQMSTNTSHQNSRCNHTIKGAFAKHTAFPHSSIILSDLGP